MDYNTYEAWNDKILLAFIKSKEAGDKANLKVFKNSVDGNLECGYGHVVLPSDKLKLGDTITLQRAEELLQQDIKKAWSIYKGSVGTAPIGICRMLVSHAYNTGAKSQTLIDLVKDGVITDKEKQWYTSHYIMSGGKVVQGLINRRNAEIELSKTT